MNEIENCTICERAEPLVGGKCADCRKLITGMAGVLRAPPHLEDLLDRPLFPGLTTAEPIPIGRTPELRSLLAKRNAVHAAFHYADMAFTRALQSAKRDHGRHCLAPRDTPIGIVTLVTDVNGNPFACSCGAEAWNNAIHAHLWPAVEQMHAAAAAALALPADDAHVEALTEKAAKAFGLPWPP